ncbi:hypothetical protein SAMN05444389_1175 [Paracoccus solventivorans]|uniref:Nucleotidyltransferase domain-containing protein n=2 Tax=Paracoccus solventivorans TaxID=53463 RepID=A0A1M7K5L9_9RHOB|nr:hypothetical protein SAMN05444389_1175 [Paracoccus solventivorans]
MSVAATLLFGSLARNDQSEGSDTDLLMINLDDETRHISIGKLSLFLYPWRQLEQDARDGDLFVCHLVREAKPIVDPDNYLDKLRTAFKFRSTYQDEVSWAVDLGWYLVRFGDELNSNLLGKRALWCIRTILIARGAEQRDPVFAPHRLAEQTQSALARDILCNRRRQHEDAVVRESLRQFLCNEAPSCQMLELKDRDAFIKGFAETSNKVALQTLRQKERSEASYLG